MDYKGLIEVSTNFDLEVVEPFLEDMSRHISSGFGRTEITKTIEMIKGLEIKGGGEIEFKPIYNGQVMRLVISVYLDDFDSPDIYFFSSPKLSDLIERTLGKKI